MTEKSFATSLSCMDGRVQLPMINLIKEKYSVDFELEYGKSTLEIHKDSINKGEKIIIIDDLIATGGTALASYNLMSKFTSNKICFFFVINLENLGGVDKLVEKNAVVTTLYNTQG